MKEYILNIGDQSDNGQVTIVDEDRLCYLVRSNSKGAVGLRTISKALLNEFGDLYSRKQDVSANEARETLCGKSEIDKFEYGYASTLLQMAKMAKEGETRKGDTSKALYLPRQIIYYGAPGTGKSHGIKKQLAGVPTENIFRTTFHPDSDYSTFVGAYKPTMEEGKIVYSFVAQTFLQAYIRAYKTDEPVYLIIEEINRGNCAQIFGDLFQLLDRDEEGKSDYKIKADADLRAFLEKELGCESDGIKGGELCLPSNLYIWATMNTSDQSLFPIDSAFKRRWDWKYMKIKDAKKGWKIGVEVKEGEKQDWWAFVEQINRVIANMTSSADKQLGYFFCKADKKADETEVEPTIISAETFVSKVVFYLWNDVFKDYGFEDGRLFKYKKIDEDGKETEEDLTFPAFYKDDDENSVDMDVVKQFIKNVMDWKAEETGKE